ncbi:hypothetical protein CTKA_00627 [Chthonomonas calidirosea]|uniref:Uncharacterized protein n=1 Tax=Chthonomonas calidirosea (strain DSM 23976 / ICMP 18418 / T49) TaxID=1303518 RepID=S0ESQ2_CHTCT|nr:hypothetical protein [Chthonomonas calidirosea]CCW34361.1 hypothetical protein CCALI_00528 [Chthonomonas calidirosea T49]CEK14994.1 hypothetical protein CTKA_00627 [Chthonomonas calidirosea]
MDMTTHIEVLGWLHIALHSFSLLVGGAILLLVLFLGHTISEWAHLTPLLVYIPGLLIGLFLCTIAVPGMILGYGLLQKTCWSRKLGLILSPMLLAYFPLGTLLGVYTFAILTTEKAKIILCH